jgi:hypothetical protein
MNNDFAEIRVPEEVKGRMEESPEVLKARYEEYYPVPASSGKPDSVTLSAPAFNFREKVDGLNNKLSAIEALGEISSVHVKDSVRFYLYLVDEVLDYMLKYPTSRGEIKEILPQINEMTGKIKNIINRSELSPDEKSGKLSELRGFLDDYINKLRGSGIFTDEAELHGLIPNLAGGKRARKTRKARKSRKAKKSKRRRGNKKQKK